MKLKAAAAALALLCLSSIATAAIAQDSQLLDDNAELPKANPDLEKQLKGQYPTMDRAAPVPLGATQKAWDAAKPDAGIYHVKWTPDTTTKINVRLGMTVTIRIPLWDKIDRPILGDQTIYHGRQVDDQTYVVWVTNPGSDTSLTLTSESRNIYNFYIRSSDYGAAFIPDNVVYIDAPEPADADGPVSSSGFDDRSASFHLAGLSDTKGKKPEWLKDVPFDPSRIRRDLALYGDQELAPDDVFRDDQFTYLCYGDRWNDGDLMVATPAVVTDGADRPVSFRVKAGCMIIQSTGQLSLKHGDAVLCVKPDPEMATPRLRAGAARVRELKPTAKTSTARRPSVAPSQPAVKIDVPSSTTPPAGAITTQPLPPPGAENNGSSNPAPNTPEKRTAK